MVGIVALAAKVFGTTALAYVACVNLFWLELFAEVIAEAALKWPVTRP
jgi:hypothetical protein